VSDPSRTPVSERPPTEPGAPGTAVQTFLIVDVRGYTRFTQERGDEAAGRLAAAFAELSREAVRLHDGEVLELRGDEALCVFASARQALRAAVQLQTSFRRGTDNGSAFPLAIGIGLDAGEGVPIEGGYRGGALNTAARLCALAGPGEILASETVVSLARRLDGIRFVDRRPVRLKGIEKPVRVHEVVPVTPLPPLPAAPKQRTRVSRRVAVLTLLGLAVGAASVGAYVLSSDEPEGLPRLEENTVGLVDTDANRLVAQVPLGGPADGIAAGAESVWVSNGLDGTVSRIDPESYDVHTIDVGGHPAGVAFGAGSIWVVNSEARAVAQIDPKSARVVQTIPVGNGPRAVAVGFGAVWVANTVDGTVSQIDLDRAQETKVISVGGSPVALAVSRDAVWVANEANGVVSRIAGRSGEVVATITVGSGPSAVAVGEGAVWVANRQDGTVSRIDPATNSVTAAVPVGPGPIALAVDEGSVWVAESGPSTLSRIDATSGDVGATVKLAASPAGLALLNDDLWTTANAPLESHRGGTLRVDSAPLDFIDPGAAWSSESWRVMTLVYDGLVGYRRVAGAAGATLVANLATHVPTPTDGGRTYTFQLRPGIRYSNGAPVRAADFRSSLERSIKVSPNPPPIVVQDLVGGTSCLKQPAACDLSHGIETNDEARTVTIHLTAPDPDFLYKMALPLASFVPADSPLRLASDEPLPGTGPYRLQTADGGRTLRLVRNRYFHVWASDARPDGYADEILIRTGAEGGEQVAAVLDGEADWAEVPTERVQALATTRPAQLHSDPFIATYYMFLNVRVPPFDDPRVRRALNLATDRRRLVELRGGPLGAQPTCQMVPPGVFGYQPHCPYTVDPGPAGTWIAPDFARASQLVEASGTRGMKITVSTFTGEEGIGRYFTTLLRQLGYGASLRVTDGEEHFAMVADSSAHVQMGATAWIADFLAASNFVALLFSCESFVPASSGNLNYSGLCDRRVDAAIDAARRAQALDPRAGGELWAAADRALTEAAAAVPFANLRAVSLVSERVENYQYHPLWGTLLDQLWVR
jgi:YVTN family beta-propeller protein